jgi:hypothetical protein
MILQQFTITIYRGGRKKWAENPVFHMKYLKSVRAAASLADSFL